MPLYDNTPQSKVRMFIGGHPQYFFGSKAVGPTCRMQITGDSVSGNVVTLNVQIVEGNIPSVGDLIYVYATANSSGNLNQTTGIAISAVSITASTGVGTVSYSKTVSNQGQTNDVGYALSTITEVGEAIALVGGVMKSRAIAIQNRVGGGYGISWGYLCPSAPSTIAIQLEGAINDNDAEYALIGSSQTTVSSTAWTEIIATLPELVNFVRVKITASTGGSSPTIVAKAMNA